MYRQRESVTAGTHLKRKQLSELKRDHFGLHGHVYLFISLFCLIVYGSAKSRVDLYCTKAVTVFFGQSSKVVTHSTVKSAYQDPLFCSVDFLNSYTFN